jgi:hypothetical protein
VLVQSEGEAWWWWYTGQTFAQVTSLLAANHARPISLAPDASGTYSVVMIDNTDTESAAINAESKRVAAVLAKGLRHAPGPAGRRQPELGLRLLPRPEQPDQSRGLP